MTHTIRFTVTGEQRMYCAGCEQRVGNALRRLPGVKSVQADAPTQQVVVTFDASQVTPEQVQAKLEQLSYQVTTQAGAQ